jgi:hypothetical protein
MVVELNDFIHIDKNNLSSDVCKFLINFFDENEELHERIDNDRKPNFTQLNLTKNSKLSDNVEKIHNTLIRKTIEYKEKYYKFIDKRCFPEKNAFEQFRIKKYQNNGSDVFDAHVDVTDSSSSIRFLSFMWYLNDVNEGGETEFLDLVIKPESGKLLVFPPLWMFPHRGNCPKSNPKYILSTYLHYK